MSVEDLDVRDRERFERECLAMGGLSWHPNVVAVYDSGMTRAGHPYLAMEFLGAGSLADRLKGGPLSWQEAVAVGVQVAGALDVAHASGTLHRDLKPENLLVGPYGETKLADFGIAAVEGAARTTTGHASFTVDHVAPELLKGEPPDERTDIYGLASTVHTLIAGAPPFATGRRESIATQMLRVLQDRPPRLHHVPDDLAELVLRALAKDPAGRTESAAELGRQLQSIQTANGIAATDLRLAPTATTAMDPTDPGDAPATSSLQSARGDSRPTARQAHPPRYPDSRPTIRNPAASTGGSPTSTREVDREHGPDPTIPDTDRPESGIFPDRTDYQFLSDEWGEVFDQVWAAYVSSGQPLVMATPVLRDACSQVARGSGTSPTEALAAAAARSSSPARRRSQPRTPSTALSAGGETRATKKPAPSDPPRGPTPGPASDKDAHEFLREEWGDVFDEVWSAYQAQQIRFAIATPVLRDACRRATKGATTDNAVAEAIARSRSNR